MTTDIKFSQLPDATVLDGTEIVPIVQGGQNVKTTINSAAQQPYESGTYTPQFAFVNVSSYSAQAAEYERIGKTVRVLITDLSFSGLDTADASNIALSLPIPAAGDMPVLISLAMDLSTGLNFSAGDTIFARANATGVAAALLNADGTDYAYNSGKINATGKVVAILEYMAA